MLSNMTNSLETKEQIGKTTSQNNLFIFPAIWKTVFANISKATHGSLFCNFPEYLKPIFFFLKSFLLDYSYQLNRLFQTRSLVIQTYLIAVYINGVPRM